MPFSSFEINVNTFSFFIPFLRLHSFWTWPCPCVCWFRTWWSFCDSIMGKKSGVLLVWNFQIQIWILVRSIDFIKRPKNTVLKHRYIQYTKSCALFTFFKPMNSDGFFICLIFVIWWNCTVHILIIPNMIKLECVWYLHWLLAHVHKQIKYFDVLFTMYLSLISRCRRDGVEAVNKYEPADVIFICLLLFYSFILHFS